MDPAKRAKLRLKTIEKPSPAKCACMLLLMLNSCWWVPPSLSSNAPIPIRPHIAGVTKGVLLFKVRRIGGAATARTRNGSVKAQ